MTPDQVIELAQEAGIDVDGPFIRGSFDELRCFAELVRNETLEEAAKLCDVFGTSEIPLLAQTDEQHQGICTTDAGTDQGIEMIDIKAIKTRASESDANGWSTSVESNDTVIALCDEVERLTQQLSNYEKHGVTCQTFRHKLTGCAECNRDDDEMVLDTMQLQAKQYFELLPELERLRKDAARYQWLRDQNSDLEADFYVGRDTGDLGDITWVGCDLDAAIDAAVEVK